MSAQLAIYEDEKFAEEFDTLKKQRTPQEQIAIDVLNTAARDAMFDELVEALSAVVSAIDPDLTGKLGRVMLEPYFERPVSVARSLLRRARLLQRSGK